ncbi:MAG: phosphoadenylyl-sulfate reductase [Candidatus Omnitrophica bacterium]|nr:phosphoadenylyl-sulfate reductase [Candidatus Omnitrophota bacterium]MCA9449488.1 phosphoadenylyl-sulfate reductase [Candidatus Omnitrophota bacterium]MCB9783702.1 phosphoadenylyl-sulfate reductase [Candidatus Omnitrophota bacterium]
MTTLTQDPQLLETLNKMDAQRLLSWGAEYHGKRAGIITSFQDTGCVMIDLAKKAGVDPRVLTIDTYRLHPETYRLIEEVEKRYGIEVERFGATPEKVEEMVKDYGEYLFFDSKRMQEYCCHIRKVEPNEEALKTLDVWYTGLRRDHSEGRKETPKASYVQGPKMGQHILKIAPLADWTTEQVWDYIKENDLPYNDLYDQGYASIGCIICSTPIRPGEDKRAGRWRWFNDENQGGGGDKECGIHKS